MFPYTGRYMATGIHSKIPYSKKCYIAMCCIRSKSTLTLNAFPKNWFKKVNLTNYNRS